MKYSRRKLLAIKKRQEKLKLEALEKDRAKRDSTELREIYDLMIKPLFRYIPDNYEAMDWVELMWGKREIFSAKAKRRLELNGQTMVAPTIAVYGYGSTIIERNSRVWIRIDHDYPEKYGVDIETEDGRWLRLNHKQYIEIAHNLIREQ